MSQFAKRIGGLVAVVAVVAVFANLPDGAPPPTPDRLAWSASSTPPTTNPSLPTRWWNVLTDAVELEASATAHVVVGTRFDGQRMVFLADTNDVVLGSASIFEGQPTVISTEEAFVYIPLDAVQLRLFSASGTRVFPVDVLRVEPKTKRLIYIEFAAIDGVHELDANGRVIAMK